MAPITPRESLDRQVQDLLDQILVLSSMVEKSTLDAVNAIKQQKPDQAKKIYQADKLINQKRFEIETACLTLIATQQPMARDLRVTASVLEIAAELERMGDYAKGNARICVMLTWTPPPSLVADLIQMAEIAAFMLHRAISAFISADAETAGGIPADDDQVDKLYNRINQRLFENIKKDPSLMDQTNLIIWAAHNLERMADRVTNICERTIYVATGEMRELDVSDDELELLTR